MIGIGFGVIFAALIALLGVLFGYPLDPLALALAIPASVAFLAFRLGTRIPLWCLGIVTSVLIGGEIVRPGDRAVLDGVLVSAGPQWLGALNASWPRVLVLVGLATLHGLRRNRPARRRSLGIAAGAAAIATVCTVFGTAPPTGLMLWAVLGNLLASAAASYLLVRSALVLPALLLAVGALLAGLDQQLIDVGTPAAIHLLLWPAYLAVALAGGALEVLVRRLRRRAARPR